MPPPYRRTWPSPQPTHPDPPAKSPSQTAPPPPPLPPGGLGLTQGSSVCSQAVPPKGLIHHPNSCHLTWSRVQHGIVRVPLGPHV